jgi:hypothetical protein
MNKSKDVWNALGHCWHEFGYDDKDYQLKETHWECIHCGIRATDPANFSNPDLTSREGTVILLEEMEKREDWPEFCDSVGMYNIWLCDDAKGYEERNSYIRVDHITQRGKLLDVVWDWLKGKGEIK